MRVTQNGIAQQFLYGIQNLSSKQMELYNQISSGQRISQSSDDPTAASQVMDLQSQQRRLNQFLDNIDRADQVSTVTYSYVSSLKDIVVRAGELATKTDDLTDSSAYDSYALEIDQLIQQAIQIGNSKQGNSYLFAGSKIDQEPFTVDSYNTDGSIASVSYQDASDVTMEINDGINISPYSSNADNTNIKDTINNLIALRDAFKNHDATSVASAKTEIVSDEDTVIDQMSRLAANQSRLEMAKTQLTSIGTSITSRVSTMADVDVATATVQYNELYNAYQAAATAGGKMMSLSLLNYLSS